MIYESGENYLEAIVMLQNEKGYVRSTDIADKLSVSKASVSRAMGVLRENGYILMDKRGLVSLTEQGEKKAEEVYERHLILTKYLEGHIGVSAEIAEKDACRMEHILSPETFAKIKEHVGKK